MREDTEKSVVYNHHRISFLGLLVTLGIVFGDIGTSPLYVMKAILHTGETINESTGIFPAGPARGVQDFSAFGSKLGSWLQSYLGPR